MNRNITIDEIFEISQKAWATTKDIQLIGCLGYDKANDIRKEIRNKLVDEGGWILPKFAVPMEMVLDKFPTVKRKLKNQGGVASAG